MKNKLKNSKSAGKRFKVSGRGKLMRRPTNTGHFNAKDGGNARRIKRGRVPLVHSDYNELTNVFPYKLEQ